MPHLARDGGEEMGAALPVHLRRAEQPHVHLVDEAGRPQRVAGPFLPHVVGGNAPELRVDQSDQLLPRRVVALAQLCDERRHAARGVPWTSEAEQPKLPPASISDRLRLTSAGTAAKIRQ